jgi:dihydrofolate synthase/folylpolyglutamate synthase
VLRSRRPAAAVESFDDVATAFDAAHRAATADDRIIAFGSFLTVADVMRALRRRTADLR